jgi:hypothetical protein
LKRSAPVRATRAVRPAGVAAVDKHKQRQIMRSEWGCRVMTSFQQLVAALRLSEKGPLTAAELHATGVTLAWMERRGLVLPIPCGDSSRGGKWKLTRAGQEEVLRCRRPFSDWLQANS